MFKHIGLRRQFAPRIVDDVLPNTIGIQVLENCHSPFYLMDGTFRDRAYYNEMGGGRGYGGSDIGGPGCPIDPSGAPGTADTISKIILDTRTIAMATNFLFLKWGLCGQDQDQSKVCPIYNVLGTEIADHYNWKITGIKIRGKSTKPGTRSDPEHMTIRVEIKSAADVTLWSSGNANVNLGQTGSTEESYTFTVPPGIANAETAKFVFLVMETESNLRLHGVDLVLERVNPAVSLFASEYMYAACLATILRCHHGPSAAKCVGLAADNASYEPGAFDAVPVAGFVALCAAQGYDQGLIDETAAAGYVNRSASAIYAIRGLRNAAGLFPHWTKDIGAGVVRHQDSEWSSVDTALALLSLYVACITMEEIGLNAPNIANIAARKAEILELIGDIDWTAFTLGNGIVSMGYDKDGVLIPFGWDPWGSESEVVDIVRRMPNPALAPSPYSKAPPVFEGRSFILEMLGLIVPQYGRKPGYDAAGVSWLLQRRLLADRHTALGEDFWGRSSGEAVHSDGNWTYFTPGAGAPRENSLKPLTNGAWNATIADVDAPSFNADIEYRSGKPIEGPVVYPHAMHLAADIKPIRYALSSAERIRFLCQPFGGPPESIGFLNLADNYSDIIDYPEEGTRSDLRISSDPIPEVSVTMNAETIADGYRCTVDCGDESPPAVGSHVRIVFNAASNGYIFIVNAVQGNTFQSIFRTAQSAASPVGFAGLPGQMRVYPARPYADPARISRKAVGINAFFNAASWYHIRSSTAFSQQQAIAADPYIPAVIDVPLTVGEPDVILAAPTYDSVSLTISDIPAQATHYQYETRIGVGAWTAHGDTAVTVQPVVIALPGSEYDPNTTSEVRVRALIKDAVSGAVIATGAWAGDSVTVPEEPIPLAPATVTAAVATSPNISVSWTDETSGHENGYEVEVQINGGSWTAIATKAQNVITHTYAASNETDTYKFRVRSINTPFASGYTESSSVSFDSLMDPSLDVVIRGSTTYDGSSTWTVIPDGTSGSGYEGGVSSAHKYRVDKNVEVGCQIRITNPLGGANHGYSGWTGIWEGAMASIGEAIGGGLEQPNGSKYAYGAWVSRRSQYNGGNFDNNIAWAEKAGSWTQGTLNARAALVDGNWHELRVKWLPGTTTLEVWFDGSLVLSHSAVNWLSTLRTRVGVGNANAAYLCLCAMTTYNYTDTNNRSKVEIKNPFYRGQKTALAGGVWYDSAP